MFNEFTKWSEEIMPEIKHVHELLSKRLSDEPEALISDLSEIEAWNSRTNALLAQADSWLDRYTFYAMPSREGRTEADRKAILDSETSPIRLVRDTIQGQCNCIKQKLILGEACLGFFKAQFAERKPRESLEKVY